MEFDLLSGHVSRIWNDLNTNLAITEYYPNLSMNPDNPLIALAGSQDNGTHLYTGQLEWNQVASGDGGWTAIDPSSPGIGYVSLTGISLFRLTLFPALTSVPWFTESIRTIDSNSFPSYILDPVTPQTMYFGTQYLYRSLDGGGIWQAISPDLTDAPAGTPSSDSTYVISTIAVSPANPNTIYTGAASGAVYQSSDGGIRGTISAPVCPHALSHISPPTPSILPPCTLRFPATPWPPIRSRDTSSGPPTAAIRGTTSAAIFRIFLLTIWWWIPICPTRSISALTRV